MLGQVSEIGLDTASAVDRWFPAIYKYLLGHTVSLGVHHSEAEDVIQDAVLRVLRTSRQFFSQYHLQSYIFTTISRCVYDRKADESRRPRITNISSVCWHDAGCDDLQDCGSMIDNACTLDGRSPGGDPYDELSARGMSPVIAMAMERLSVDSRQLLTLAHINELTYEEVALTLNIPITTVRSRLSKAASQLRIQIIRLDRENWMTSKPEETSSER